MQSTTETNSYYHIIIPVSFICMIITVIFASLILVLISCIQRLHTVTYLLVANGAIASIFYCIVQSVNYSFLAFLPWKTSDMSCRWRGYFSYMTVVAIVYSYLSQAISRFLMVILSSKYRWVTTFRTHRILLLINWILVICLPLPALLTDDIYFRSASLCWVPKEYTLHLAYIIIVDYLIPTCLLIGIYLYIYCRVKRRRQSQVFISMRANRDLDVLYNIMILFSIYIFGALPLIIYNIVRVDVFYAIGLISISFGVAVKNFVALLIDHELRTMMKNYIQRSINRIVPLVTST